MAWTTPYTFVDAGIQKASVWRTYVSDNLQYLYDNRWDASLFDYNLLTAICSGTLSLTGAEQDIPGMTVTLDRTGYWLILGVFDTESDSLGVDATIRLKVNGAESGINLYNLWPGGVRVTQSGLWVYDAASQPLTAKFTAWATASSGSIYVTGSRMAAWAIQSP